MDALKDFIFPCNRAVSRVNQNDFRTLESATPPQFWLNLADRSKFQAHETFRDRVRAERAEPAKKLPCDHLHHKPSQINDSQL
jgi:hypothetical protein